MPSRQIPVEVVKSVLYIFCQWKSCKDENAFYWRLSSKRQIGFIENRLVCTRSGGDFPPLYFKAIPGNCGKSRKAVSRLTSIFGRFEGVQTRSGLSTGCDGVPGFALWYEGGGDKFLQAPPRKPGIVFAFLPPSPSRHPNTPAAAYTLLPTQSQARVDVLFQRCFQITTVNKNNLIYNIYEFLLIISHYFYTFNSITTVFSFLHHIFIQP